ncbi:MAG: hypothetical protein R2880_09225 [Deinococcales bacterium]
MLGVSKRTIENWEQGRRKPVGAARALLLVADRYPEAVLSSIQPVQGFQSGMKASRLEGV